MARKILLIDDEELVIKSLVKLLEHNGFGVFAANNGNLALEVVEKEAIDLIIADVRMPGINGVETFKLISDRTIQKYKKNIPVIFITGYADENIEEEARSLKPAAYIYKPFDVYKLLSTIREVLR